MARTPLDDMQDETDDLDDYVDELRHKLDVAARELAEWRSGKRRVFWRLKHAEPSAFGLDDLEDYAHRKTAMRFHRAYGIPVARVTVKPKAVTS